MKKSKEKSTAAVLLLAAVLVVVSVRCSFEPEQPVMAQALRKPLHKTGGMH